jgi:hypothetical protein
MLLGLIHAILNERAWTIHVLHHIPPGVRTSPKLYRRTIQVLLKNQASVIVAGLVSRLRFRVPILDLNQIKSPRAQPIVQSVRHFCE